MSYQFELLPPPPRKERGLRTLTLYYPWSQTTVLYKLDELGLRALRILGPVDYRMPIKPRSRCAALQPQDQASAGNKGKVG
ncbi:hypothetical protein OU995_03490 [Roseateles sp. SL47]|uniref:hypothetical protein n=1 Tax=Roseateles sp. SL47 TaxID=2995138 RepID=UPI0022700989|nr:hypothetical protein [Roseateles sp. SL47]WAC73813.1 hypothetical protein OU995_03490 [Roseateles sp. SL47]